MTLQEYIAQAKAELDKMEANWIAENAKDPKTWPMEFDDVDWREQELAERF